MIKSKVERRRETRLRYQLPVWFADSIEKKTCRGFMVDISTSGLAFDCDADENCPHQGQLLTARYDLPRAGKDFSHMESFTRSGHVCRVEPIDDRQRRVAIQFDEPPPFWDTPPRRK